MDYDVVMAQGTTDLTINDVAEQLRMTTDGVYKLIQRHHLRAERPSARKMYVTQEALDQFFAERKQRVKGIRDQMPKVSAEDLRARFVEQTGRTPEDWLADWTPSGVEDSPENAHLLVQAVALRRGSKNKALIEEPASPEWAIAALRTLS